VPNSNRYVVSRRFGFTPAFSVAPDSVIEVAACVVATGFAPVVNV